MTKGMKYRCVMTQSVIIITYTSRNHHHNNITHLIYINLINTTS